MRFSEFKKLFQANFEDMTKDAEHLSVPLKEFWKLVKPKTAREMRQTGGLIFINKGETL